MEFIAERQCKKCKNKDEYCLTIVEAAFSLKDNFICSQICRKCGYKGYSGYSYKRPDIDQELLDIWGNNPYYYFMDQDEDIILADMEYVSIFLNAIDKRVYPQEKLNILFSALCILLYDNSSHNGEYSDEENKKREQYANIIQSELLKRNHLILEIQDKIMNYIKIKVFPLIDLKT